MEDISKVLKFIANCTDPERLRILISNAHQRRQEVVALAALKRMVDVSPAEKPGTVEHDLWRTIFTLEHLLKEERGKTVLLIRTRQKLKRVGVRQTLHDWAVRGTKTTGFTMLVDRGLPELTGEAIVLRHPEVFRRTVVAAARHQLKAVPGVSEQDLWPKGRDYRCLDD